MIPLRPRWPATCCRKAVDGRIFSDLMHSRAAVAVGAVLGLLALFAALALLAAFFRAASEVMRVGVREYLRRALELDSEHVRFIAVLIWVVIAILLLAMPFGFTLGP